jgi:hypothetical protein
VQPRGRGGRRGRGSRGGFRRRGAVDEDDGGVDGVREDRLHLRHDRRGETTLRGLASREVAVQPEQARVCDAGQQSGQQLAAVAVEQRDVGEGREARPRTGVERVAQLDGVDPAEGTAYGLDGAAEVVPNSTRVTSPSRSADSRMTIAAHSAVSRMLGVGRPSHRHVTDIPAHCAAPPAPATSSMLLT